MTDCTENEHKNRSFFFLIFCCIVTPVSGTIDHYCTMENIKKYREKNRNRLRTIYPKNHKNFKNSKCKVQYYLLLYKMSVLQRQAIVLHNNHSSIRTRKLLQCHQRRTSSFWWCYFFLFFEWQFLFLQVINKTKFSKVNSLNH